MTEKIVKDITDIFTVKVAFTYTEKYNEVSAIFVDYREKNGEYTCYAHIGQHCTATFGWIIEQKEATPEQYKDLLKELQDVGYNPVVVPLFNCKKTLCLEVLKTGRSMTENNIVDIKTETPITRVGFVYYEEDDLLVAVFVDQLLKYDGVKIYARGEESSYDVDWLIRQGEARPAQYAGLLQELQSKGYNPLVVDPFSYLQAYIDSKTVHKRALAYFLQIPSENIIETTYKEFYAGSATYLCIQGEVQRLSKVTEYIEEMVETFLPEFLTKFTGLPLDWEDLDNKTVLTLINKVGAGLDTFVQKAVEADGYGHFLSGYDGVEHTVEYEGLTYYIYRVY